MTTSPAGYRAWVRLGALILPLATCALIAGTGHAVAPATASLILVVWVVAGAATGDRLAGLLAAVSGGAWYDFFLTAPYHSFRIADADDVEVTVLLVLIGALVVELALWGRRQQAVSVRRRGYLEGVLGAAREASADDADEHRLVATISQQIRQVLHAGRVEYRDGSVRDRRIAILDRDGEVSREGRQVDVDRSGLPVDEHTAVLVRRRERVIGHFLVSAAGRRAFPTREERRVAGLLADQVVGLLDNGGVESVTSPTTDDERSR